MVLAKCSKCGKGYRTTKAKEGMCANCTVESCPLPDNPQEIDNEFAQIAGTVYGNSDSELAIKAMDSKDVFNHEKRLTTIKNDIQNTKQSKERNRQSREVNRLLEEHAAVQARIEELKDKCFKAALLFPSTATTGKSKKPPPIIVTPSSIQLESNKVESPPPVTPVAVIKAALFGTSLQKSQTAPTRTTPPATSQTTACTPSNSITIAAPKSPIKDTTTSGRLFREASEAGDKITPLRSIDEIIPLKNTDEETPLKRSNSVRNRIKAFEDLTRRASTGSWDRVNNVNNVAFVASRRKLEFQ